MFILLITCAAFYGVIDLLAILPYYIEIMLRQDTVSCCICFWTPF